MTVVLSLAVASASAAERTYQQKRGIAERLLGNAAQLRKSPSTGGGTAEIKTLDATAAYTVMGYDGGGFAIIANDDTHDAVVGYSPTSRFAADVPALKWYLSMAERALSAETHPLRVSIPDGCRASVSHLVTTKWNQDDPYWSKCPTDNRGNRCYTGCVATGMAQIMRFYKYPSTGEGKDTVYYNNHPYVADFGSTSYDWDNMPDTYTGSYTVAQKLAVATLMYHCGIATNMTYSPYGSGAYLSDAANGLAKHFGYTTKYYGYKDYPVTDNYDDAAWREVVYRELSANHPILYAGASVANGEYNISYHAFVLDGYDKDGNVGVNWGYGGVGDGYFSLDVMECSAYTPSEKYTMYHEMVVIHHPDAGAVDYPLSPTGIEQTVADAPADGVTRVYDTAGRLVYSAPAASFSTEGIGAHGVFIVKNGGTARKIVLQ